MHFFRQPWAAAPCAHPPCTAPAVDLVPALLRAIQGEAEARQAYLKLLPMAHTGEAVSNIRTILDDELKHLQVFTGLLANLAPVCPAPVRVPEPALADYEEGIREAYYDELDAAEFYRSVMLCATDPQVWRSFFEAMTDEMEHATRLNRLLSLASRQRV